MNLNKLIQVGALPKIIANTFDGAFVILMITLDLVRMVRPARYTSGQLSLSCPIYCIKSTMLPLQSLRYPIFW